MSAPARPTSAVRDPTVDEITARLREEDARLRRRTLWLTLLPVLVGLAVLGTAWWGVREAGREKAALDLRIQEQQGAIDDLKAQRTALDRDIATRKDMLEHYAARLPLREREEVAQLQQGLEQAQKGDAESALRAYDSAIASDERNPLPYRMRGNVLYAQGAYELAGDSLRRALERDPRDAQARYTLGLSLWALERRDEAVAEIQRAFENPEVKARALQDPAFQPIRGTLDARAGQESGRSVEEKQSIDAGLQAARRGDFAAAIAAYDRALSFNPDNPRILNWKGYALFRSQAYAEAIASFERAAKLAPEVAEIHYNMALALWKSGRRDDALKALQRAYDADPSFRAVAARDPQSRELRAAARPAS
ncbi:tetratricopeptide repeat protein [uncultured Piscinibacter sp.]|uniref:tetratricopeptide repeat protein n=1 Tax=uncultured Piscinibacter sp. TaxID=1131835 RepID=UPI0026298AC4|nr:tetratricopeptide repeat protein [uncultured Piscinibacter sp.]